ncbi:MAG: hypothetical protein QNK37_12245 [Acidobacteriota bacterium]|nr:hypothetical protein [Acidobacteriota bacterium]
MNYCSDCGEKRLNRARFCHSCGFAYPGASNHILALGLCVVVFLAGLSYAVIQRIVLPNMPEEAPVVAAVDNHDHDDHEDHDHEEDTVAVGGGGTARPNHAAGAAGTPFASVEQFFRSHGIMGPKVFSFKVIDDSRAIIYLDGFPMDKMPEAMRKGLDDKIKQQLEPLGEGTILEVRDARDRRLLAGYGNE